DQRCGSDPPLLEDPRLARSRWQSPGDSAVDTHCDGPQKTRPSRVARPVDGEQQAAMSGPQLSGGKHNENRTIPKTPPTARAALMAVARRGRNPDRLQPGYDPPVATRRDRRR